VHKALNAIRGVEAQDVFPTIYRLNTAQSIQQVAVPAGFSSAEVLLFEAQPNYLTLHPLLFRCWRHLRADRQSIRIARTLSLLHSGQADGLIDLLARGSRGVQPG